MRLEIQFSSLFQRLRLRLLCRKRIVRLLQNFPLHSTRKVFDRKTVLVRRDLFADSRADQSWFIDGSRVERVFCESAKTFVLCTCGLRHNCKTYWIRVTSFRISITHYCFWVETEITLLHIYLFFISIPRSVNDLCLLPSSSDSCCHFKLYTRFYSGIFHYLNGILSLPLPRLPSSFPPIIIITWELLLI